MRFLTSGKKDTSSFATKGDLRQIEERAEEKFLNNNVEEKLLVNFNANNHKIINVANPTESLDASNKEYVDYLKSQLDDLVKLHEQQVVNLEKSFNSRISNLRKEIENIEASLGARMTDLTNASKTAFDSHGEQLVAVDVLLNKFFIP